MKKWLVTCQVFYKGNIKTRDSDINVYVFNELPTMSILRHDIALDKSIDRFKIIGYSTTTDDLSCINFDDEIYC